MTRVVVEELKSTVAKIENWHSPGSPHVAVEQAPESQGEEVETVTTDEGSDAGLAVERDSRLHRNSN